MSIFVIVIHVIVSFALILIVLLQTGKGADMGAAFGGGASQTLFGASGGATFLGKMTTVAAIIFMLTSLVLAYMSGHRGGKSVIGNTPAPIEQPAPATNTAAPTTTQDAAPQGKPAATE